MSRLSQNMFANISPKFHLVQHKALKEISKQSKAADVLMDFSKRSLPFVNQDVLIDFAIIHLKQASSGLCVVSNKNGDYLGLLSSKNLEREMVLNRVAELGISREKLTVYNLMSSLHEIGAIDEQFVNHASIDQLLSLLCDSENAHVFVVRESQKDIVGLVSVSEICRYLGFSNALTYKTNSFKQLCQQL